MIDLLATAEQQEIADAISRFLCDILPAERLRADHATRSRHEREPAIWSQLADLGCFGLSLPERDGGIGLTLAEEALAFREYGRFLISPAMLGTVLAARIAARSGNTALVADLVAGKRRAGVAIAGNPNTPAGQTLLLDVDVDGLFVIWDDEGARLFDRGSLGDTCDDICIDRAVTMTRTDLANGAPLAGVRADEEPLAEIAAMLIAAMLTGSLDGICAMAVAQAQTREQFGQAIGTFQAIKHKVADIGLGAECAWSQTVYAALALAAGADDAPFQAWNAKLIAGKAALDAARANIQIHGGMGFTAEINAHLFLKRVHVLNELGGGLRALQAKILALPVAA